MCLYVPYKEFWLHFIQIFFVNFDQIWSFVLIIFLFEDLISLLFALVALLLRFVWVFVQSSKPPTNIIAKSTRNAQIHVFDTWWQHQYFYRLTILLILLLLLLLLLLLFLIFYLFLSFFFFFYLAPVASAPRSTAGFRLIVRARLWKFPLIPP
jgi:hypothetical protein